MKDLKKMTKKDRKEILIGVCVELQDICEFEPAIKTDGMSEKEIITKLEEAYEALEPSDKLSEEAISTFEFLGLRELEVAKEEKEEEPAKKEKKEPAKKEKVKSMALVFDDSIEEKGTWDDISGVIEEEYANRNIDKACTAGAIKSHIKYRLGKDAKWLKSRKLKMTDEGIE